MMTRCYNADASHFKHYQGKGIKVCEQWQTVEGFYSDMGGSWKQGLTLDRINPDGDYTPENTRWLDRSENCRRARKWPKGKPRGPAPEKEAERLRSMNVPRCQKVMGDGVLYASISDAKRALGFHRNAIAGRCRSPHFVGWYYVD